MPHPNAEVVVAALQLQAQSDVAANLERCAALVALARRRGAEVAVLPENFAFMGSEDDKRAIAERLEEQPTCDGPMAAALRAMARTHGIVLVAGGMPERSDDPERPYNTCLVVDADGRFAARYRKIHLFDVDVGDGQSYRESRATTPGDRAVVTEAAGLRLGLSVCYDLRFPELYRALADGGAEAFVVPAAFTLLTGKDHWHVLLRARAIESQAYVVAAAQHGVHPGGRRTYGKACIVDPWGDVIAQASEGEGIALAVVERRRVVSARASLPSLAHRRPFAPAGA